jgi:hypothetical protein
MGNFTAKEKADCAQREVGQRVRVYKRLVDGKRMAAASAQRQIEIMQEIADEYRAQVPPEPKQEKLL